MSFHTYQKQIAYDLISLRVNVNDVNQSDVHEQEEEEENWMDFHWKCYEQFYIKKDMCNKIK